MCLFNPHIDWTKTHTHAHTHTCSLQHKCSTKLRPAALKMNELMHMWLSYDINPTDLCFIYSWTVRVNVCPTPLNPLTVRSITIGSILKLSLGRNINLIRLSVRMRWSLRGGDVTWEEMGPLPAAVTCREWSMSVHDYIIHEVSMETLWSGFSAASFC